MVNWYDKVSKDINCIPDAVAHFNTELEKAKKETYLSGLIEKAAANLPAIVENRFSQLQEIEAILEYLNIELRRLRASKFRNYIESYQRALSSRDAEKFVDGESDVVDFEKIINEFALIRNKWLGIIKGLDQKQWQLTNIVKLRTSGLDDASI
jgi:hypothetical protein|tara:strand:- start:802 stop:1260 length:459 start_codon:yes stop_codon:yes gene_type:complete